MNERSPALSERFEMKIDRDLLERLDQWRQSCPQPLSRAKAIRHLIESGLDRGDPGQSLQLSGGETLTAVMLASLMKHLHIKDDIDPELVLKAIQGGHYWMFPRELRGIFHGHADAPDSVELVVQVLDMWTFIEEALDALAPDAQQRVAEAAGMFGADLKFPGFDGNREAEHLQIARFLVFDLKQFGRFGAAHDNLDAHRPMGDAYGAMLRVFKPLQEALAGQQLSEGELVRIFRPGAKVLA